MKKLLTILGILLFLTDVNAQIANRAIHSNWDGYMWTYKGQTCIKNTDIVIDIYITLEQGASLPNSYIVRCSINNRPDEVISFANFTLSGNNEYMTSLSVDREYLGSNIDYSFEIIPFNQPPSGILFGYNGAASLIEEGSKKVCNLIYTADPELAPVDVAKSDYSSTDITEKKTEFSVFPNPFLDNMQIVYNAKENEDVEIKILDLNGSVVYMLKENNILAGNYQLNIDTGDIRKGIYFCHIRTKTQNQVIKLMKKE